MIQFLKQDLTDTRVNEGDRESQRDRIREIKKKGKRDRRTELETYLQAIVWLFLI